MFMFAVDALFENWYCFQLMRHSSLFFCVLAQLSSLSSFERERGYSGVLESSTISVDPVCLIPFMAATHRVCVPICFLSGNPTLRIGNHIQTQAKTKTNIPTWNFNVNGEHTSCRIQYENQRIRESSMSI
jgi:hypothetical protein